MEFFSQFASSHTLYLIVATMMLNNLLVIAILLFVSAVKINGSYFLWNFRIFFINIHNSCLIGEADLKGRLLTPQEGCGLTKVKNTRIVGGSEAPAGSFPWFALLGRENQFFNEIKLKFFCGGSLITSRHVLTAAHCIENDL